MIHELIITYRPEDGSLRIDRAAATGVTNAVLLHTMLEGGITFVKECGPRLPGGQPGFTEDVCAYVKVMYNPNLSPNTPGRRTIEVGIWGVDLTNDECCGILSAAKEAAHDIAQRNKMMKMVREEIKQVLGPDGQPMRRINDG